MSDEDDLNELRKKQLLELQKKQVVEQQKKQLLSQMLDSAAYERMMNIRLADSDLYDQLVSFLLTLYQQGQVKGKLSEKQLLALLHRVKSGQREPTITVKHK